jgi:hypothetical protein
LDEISYILLGKKLYPETLMADTEFDEIDTWQIRSSLSATTCVGTLHSLRPPTPNWPSMFRPNVYRLPSSVEKSFKFESLDVLPDTFSKEIA